MTDVSGRAAMQCYRYNCHWPLCEVAGEEAFKLLVQWYLSVYLDYMVKSKKFSYIPHALKIINLQDIVLLDASLYFSCNYLVKHLQPIRLTLLSRKKNRKTETLKVF